MQTFKDNQGETWTLGLTLGKVRQIRMKLGLDLLKPLHHTQVLDSLTDQLTFAFLLVEDVAKERGVSIDDFEERLYGESVAHEASIAFLQECAFFFQNLGMVEAATKTQRVIRVMKEIHEQQIEMSKTGQLDSLLDAVEDEWRATVNQTTGKSSQN